MRAKLAGIRGGIHDHTQTNSRGHGEYGRADARTRAAPARESNVTTQGRDEAMQITRAGSQPSNKGSGTTSPELCGSTLSSQYENQGGSPPGSVTFEPGARTAWHRIPWGRP